MSSVKTLKKGEYLFKENDKIQVVYVLQSGQLSFCLTKNKKNIDILTVSAGYVFADWSILGIQQYVYSCLALNEVKVLEIPLESFKQQHESLNPVYKSFVKSMAEKYKWSLNEVKNIKLENNAIPCSDDSIPQVFGILFHTVNHKGLKENEKIKIDWMTLKHYSQRVFGESIKRIEQATQILVKLKMADYVYGKKDDEPNSPDEIQAFVLNDLLGLETFFEYYQYYYYRGGRTDLLKFDESNYNVLRLMLLCYEGEAADRFGIVSKDFNLVVDLFKEYGIALNQGHFVALESKGLFVKRKSTDDNKVILQFELKEYKTQLEIWKLLREIERWNERGFVDMKEVDYGLIKKSAQSEHNIECPDCHSVMVAQSKFCSECGAKLIGSDLTSTDTVVSERKAA